MIKYTLEDKKRWLEAFTESDINVTEACKKTGINRIFIKEWRLSFREELFIDGFKKCTFEEAYAECKGIVYDKIQSILINKAVNDKDIEMCKYLSERIMKHLGYGTEVASVKCVAGDIKNEPANVYVTCNGNHNNNDNNDNEDEDDDDNDW